MNHQNTRKRSIGTGLVIGIVIGLIAMFSIRCNKEDNPSPVSFTPAPAPNFNSTTSGSSGNNDPTPAPPAPPAPVPPTNDVPAKQRYSFDILSSDGVFQLDITHTTGTTAGRVGVACYENPYKTTGERQIYYRSKVANIIREATRNVQAKIPQCVYWQCDGFEGDAITGPAGEEIDVFYGRRLIVGRSGGPQGDCSPPPPPCPNPPCNPPPPQCDLEQLERDAAAECDEGNFNLNVEACTFECKPPPPSCEQLFNVTTEIDGDQAWIFLKNTSGQTVGQEHRALTLESQNGQVCVGDGQDTLRTIATVTDEPCCLPWKLPARPPTCEEDPPPAFGETDGSVEITQNHDGSWNADAEVNWHISGAPGTYEIQIFWVNGQSTFVKKSLEVRLDCDGEKRGQITWNSSERECTHGHVNPSAEYYQRVYYEGQLIEEGLIGVGSATCDEDECEPPDIGTVESFTGPGDPDTECEAFGDFMAAEEGDEIDFLICKAGNDREVVPLDFDGLTCPGNGKDVSHITECICEEDDDSSEE